MSDRRCGAELCTHWTGDGCACAVFGIERECGPCAYNDCGSCDESRAPDYACCCSVAADFSVGGTQ